jgi:3-dehydroquinate synthase II
MLSLNLLILWFTVLVTYCQSFVPEVQNLPKNTRHHHQRHQSSSFLKGMEVWWDGRESDQWSNCFNLEEDVDVILVNAGEIETLTSTSDRKKSCWMVQDGHRLIHSKEEDKTVGIVVELQDAAGQEEAMAALGSVEWILVSSGGWKMIPAENLIAAAQSTGTKLAFCVDQASDVGGLARALELGVDALCVPADASTELCKAVLDAAIERNAEEDTAADTDTDTDIKTTPQIVSGACWRHDTQGTVLADRICVDLVQSLQQEEGCWIGSSAKILALVLSEAAASQFVPTRPFRVNAGPVHSYILLADGTTKYLCELQAADQVQVYNTVTGDSRPVAVGRLKQEVRPCVLVELHSKDQHSAGQVFLQQAETVRLGQEGGESMRVTDLKVQNEPITTESLLLRIQTTGTHIGKAYTGKVEER